MIPLQLSTADETFLGIGLFDFHSLMHLLLHFMFNLLVSWIIVHFFYYKRSRRKDYYFTFMMFSSAMFLLLFVMENVKLQIGLALGLFAVFGMIRYRTENIPVREMTYLFVIITLSIINGLSLNITYDVLLLANLLLIGLIWMMESLKNLKTASKLVNYDRIDMIVPEKREELIADLEKRLGLKIQNVEIGSVDFMKDSAILKVTYMLTSGRTNSVDSVSKFKEKMDDE